MKFYEGLKLPDLAPFRAESVSGPTRSMPRPLDMKLLAAMEAATPKLANEDPGVYVAHLLFSRLGLRNIEIINAARIRILYSGRIGIIDRPEKDFFPKGSEGWVPIASDVLAEILRFQPLCFNGYLIPGQTRTERHDSVYRRHSKWVSQWIKDKAKTSYELLTLCRFEVTDNGSYSIPGAGFSPAPRRSNHTDVRIPTAKPGTSDHRNDSTSTRINFLTIVELNSMTSET